MALSRTNLAQSPLWSLDPPDFHPLSHTFALCLDAVDGGCGANDFTWSLLLLKCLRLGRRVAVLSFAHPREHYVQLLRRYGLECSALESQGALLILRVLPAFPSACLAQVAALMGQTATTTMTDTSTAAPDYTTAVAAAAAANASAPSWPPSSCISFEQARAFVDSLTLTLPAPRPQWSQSRAPNSTPSPNPAPTPPPPQCLFIDDLEALDALAPSAVGARAFMAAAFAALALRAAPPAPTSAPTLPPDSTTATATLAPGLDTLCCFGRDGPHASLHAAKCPGLTAVCACRAHVVASARPLASGASSEASGLLDVDYLGAGAGAATGGYAGSRAAERWTYKVTGSEGVLVSSRLG